MQNGTSEGTEERHITPAHTAQMPTNLSQMKLNSQEHLQPRMAEEPRPKQADVDERKKNRQTQWSKSMLGDQLQGEQLLALACLLQMKSWLSWTKT